jgi:HlyD family type I secretion membrane fusion protein
MAHMNGNRFLGFKRRLAAAATALISLAPKADAAGSVQTTRDGGEIPNSPRADALGYAALTGAARSLVSLATKTEVDGAISRGEIPDWRRTAALGYAVIIFTFGILGGWSAVAKLDSAIIAQGLVTVETNRKTVQHFEGGIVREILVREGERVAQGNVLFRLDTTQSQANFDNQRAQLDYNLAVEARLLAERDGADAITFPDELKARSDEPHVAGAMADQRNQFTERRASVSGQVGVLQSKVDQYKNEIDGLNAERTASQSQLDLIAQELKDLHYLLEKNLVAKTRVLSLEREKSKTEGVIGHTTAEIAKAENNVHETQLQMRQLREKFLEDVAGAILEVHQKASELRQKLTMATDVLKRVEVLAPKSGVVQNLRVFTIGGVLKAGEPLLDIVPERDELIIQAHVSPLDIDKVAPGMDAEIRLPSFHGELLPVMTGRIDSVSRDRLMDEQAKEPYFLAQILVDDKSVPADVRRRLTAGMPAEIILPTGERTVLQYLVGPLQNRMRGAMREK